MNKMLRRAIMVPVCLLVLFSFSCKSTPPAEPEETAPVADVGTPVAEETKSVDEQLTALKDRAQELEEFGIKYGIHTWKADEWASVAAVHETGRTAYGTDYDLAFASFTTAIAGYEKLIDESFAEIAVEMEKRLQEARAAVIAAGGDAYFLEEFAQADASVDQARVARDSGDYAAAYDAAQIALMRYRVLELGMQAYALNQTIVANNFGQYASEEYNRAGTRFDEAAALYGSADPAALDAAVEVVALLTAVKNAGYRVWAEEEVRKADSARILCDSIKAERSMPQEYKTASDQFRSAFEKSSQNEWEPAYFGYRDSAVLFTQIYQEVTLKRNAADLAMQQARNKQEQSRQLALKADEIAPLDENAEGFDPDTEEVPSSGASGLPETEEPAVTQEEIQ